MRVEQSASHLMNFMHDLQNGLLLPAAFQRPYVWSEADIGHIVNASYAYKSERLVASQ